MEIIIENKKLYIWSLIALCGEVLKHDLINNFPESAQSTYSEIRKLKTEKFISEVKTEFGQVLRLSSPHGTDLLKYLPPLKNQYNLMTGGKDDGSGGRFHNKGQSLKKRIERSKIILKLLNENLSINNIKIQYVKKAGRKKLLTNIAALKENPTPLTLSLQPTLIPHIFYVMPEENDLQNDTCEELLKKASVNNPNFFTSNIIKRYKDGTESYTQTLSINPSRIIGAVINKKKWIALYYMENEKLKITHKAEKAISIYLDRIYRNVYGSTQATNYRKAAENGIAIIFTSENVDLKKYISYPGEKNASITQIYSKVYIQNIDDEKLLNNLTDIRYEQNIVEEIFDEEEIERAKQKKLHDMCDAITDDHIALEAISMNIVKLEKSMILLENTNAEIEIFCKECQKEMLSDCYSKYKDRVKITVLKNI